MRRLLLPLSAVFVIHCSDPAQPTDAPPGDDAPPSAICLEANDHSDLAWIQDKIFTPSCSGFSACHKGAARQAGNLNLEAGNSHSNLVNKPSGLFPQFQLVKPTDAANSYLMIVMGHFAGPLDNKSGTMPYNSAVLCIEKRRAVERWVTAGAPAN
ncbi:MAG: hypothetical protein KBG15_10250 [Kofleriaceae bacterium]|nr:hypothetical protein [Kofleriaceae bacterium]